MSTPDDMHKQAFREEASELLSELENSLLELEENPENEDLIGRVFRAMHTIKGSGAMFGFDEISHFTHNVETVFDLVRSGEIPVTKDLIDLTLKARDQITTMMEAEMGGDPPDRELGEKIIAGFVALIPSNESKAQSGPAEKKPEPEKLEPRTYRVRFVPNRDIFKSGTNPVYLLDELKELGDCKVLASLKDIPVLSQFDPEACYTGWDVIITTDKDINDIKDVFIFVEDSCEVSVKVIDDPVLMESPSKYKKIGEILVERGDIKPETLQTVLEEQKPIGEMLVSKGLVTKDRVESALEEQKTVKEIRSKRQTDDSASTVRVPAERLDKLVNLVGELVIVQARLSQTSSVKNEPILSSIAEEIEHLTRELQDSTLSIRMLPIGSTFSRFKRLVRDLSAELGKDIEMTTDGADTELDKTVIDKLNDPMVHLIRNSIDHGIEPPDVRKAVGKPDKGTVHLSAAHSGANVLITIKDDGAGLNPRSIKLKAIERGLISPDADLPEKELFGLIFQAGFSTAEKVTSVSGRGVGMDVVRKCIDSLQGSIDINSKEGEGTIITLKLPLTLAIIEGLLVNIGDESYVLPLSAVEECVELSKKEVDAAHGRHIINIRGEIVPYIRLRDLFRIKGERKALEQIVIARINGERIGFVVDSVIGQHQTVIKNLGVVYRKAKGLSGATILGDGSVALILDIQQIVDMARDKEVTTVA
ncbi:MAG: chemotaxis protein CheA [Firmicutes bacterium]|nr:chemotaxis protein CheA [Bacillota bacterium]